MKNKLIYGLKKTGGRNNLGRITVFHKGGGHKKKYRIIEFKRNKWVGLNRVENIEYDPNRSANIAKIFHLSTSKSYYIIAPHGLKQGDIIQTQESLKNFYHNNNNNEGMNFHFDIRSPGHCLPLKELPPGTLINNIEIFPGSGSSLIRAAGTSARLLQSLSTGYSIILLNSGERRLLKSECFAVTGQISNPEHFNKTLDKAGANRWRGIRPTVRGVAMNPVDHPHGGGEGKTSGGRPSVSPWGKLTKGVPTRKSKKKSEKLILEKRQKIK